MKLFIYRDYNGKKYPAFFSRIIMALLITLLSIQLLNGEITKAQFNFFFIFRFIVIAIVQEWIFRIHLVNSVKFYNIFALWKYFLIQVVVGVLLPTWLMLHYKSQLYSGSLLNKTKDEIMQMDMALFYPHTILIINMIFFGCFLAKTHYTNWIVVKAGTVEYSFTPSSMDAAIFHNDEITILLGDEWIIAKASTELKSEMKNLDPKYFKIWAGKIYINIRLLRPFNDKSKNSLLDYLDKMVLELREDYWVEFLKEEIERINREKA